MKKLLKLTVLFLCVAFTFLVGCGGGGNNDGGGEQPQKVAVSVAGVTGATLDRADDGVEITLATKVRSPKNARAYIVDQKKIDSAIKVFGLTEQEIEDSGFDRFTFSILTENGIVPTIKFTENTPDISSQTSLKNADSYLRIYNEEESRMSCYNAGQWTMIEVKASYLTQMQILVGENQSYYIADARIEKQNFGVSYSPIPVFYAGRVVGGMVAFNYTERQASPDGRTSLIADDNCARFTSTTKDNVSCIKVETKGVRRAILQPIGFDEGFISANQIQSISFKLRVDGTTDNIMVRAYDKNDQKLFHASPKISTEMNTYAEYLSVNNVAGAVLGNGWQTLTAKVGQVRDISSYSVFEGIDLHLYVNSGSFYIAEVTLS